MSDQVTITIHRRNADGTWPQRPPPTYRLLLVTLQEEHGGVIEERCDVGVVKGETFCGRLTTCPATAVTAWSDVTEALK